MCCTIKTKALPVKMLWLEKGERRHSPASPAPPPLAGETQGGVGSSAQGQKHRGNYIEWTLITDGDVTVEICSTLLECDHPV
jgi:hypothetical protein